MKVLDLFCGCGGLALGFKQAGCEIIGGIDHDGKAIATFNKNLGNGWVDDLSDANWIDNFKANTGQEKIDILIGGPPCQGFSLTGTRKFDDERNKLYNAVFLGAQALKPKVVVIENVRGMATLYGGQAKAQVIDKFTSLGYNVTMRILDSAHYGVPQHRLRLFFVAAVPEISFEWPEATHDPNSYVSCEEALSDLPSMDNDSESDTADYLSEPLSKYQKKMRKGSKIITNHRPTVHKQFVVDTIRQVPEGGNYKDLPPGVGESRKFNEAWTRYHSKKPSKTIDTGHRNHFHYKYDRVPTIRENARLQSFPDKFEFLGSKTEQNRQVGNAVPVLLAEAIARQIKSSLKE